MSKREAVKQFVYKQIVTLWESRETGGGKARLAHLRRGAGKVPGEMPELWGSFLDGLDESLYSTNGEATYAEWAVYLTLTLFALHQQGGEKLVHCQGESLGFAAAKLIDETKDEDEERRRIMRRFAPVITASSMPQISHYLRSMVKLFKANDVALDYVALASDLYDFQFEDKRSRVQLRWGEKFYKNKKGDK